MYDDNAPAPLDFSSVANTLNVSAIVYILIRYSYFETHIVFFYHVLHIWLYHLAEAVQARSSDPVRWSSGRKFRERRHLQDEMAVCVYAITCVCFCEF